MTTCTKEEQSAKPVRKRTARAVQGKMCYRCEERARFLDGNAELMLACGDLNRTVTHCTYYKPVKPCLLKPVESFDAAKERSEAVLEFCGVVEDDDVEYRMTPFGNHMIYSCVVLPKSK